MSDRRGHFDPADPQPLPLRTYQAFAGQGFPWRMVNAFQAAADHTDCVVMTRVPGPTTTMLIDERYDLKNFNIKAKSCDWGPMAGFLCALPHFNKSGYDGVAFNTEKHLETYEKLDQGPAGPDFFPHIKISTERKRWLDDYLERTGCVAAAVTAADASTGNERNAVVGIAVSQEKPDLAAPRRIVPPTVMMEFYLVASAQPADVWELWHGEIFYRPGGSGEPWGRLGLTELPEKLRPAEAASIRLPAAVGDKLDELRGKIHGVPLFDSGRLTRFYPVRGVRNVNAAVMEPDDPLAYKNAVSGDYDLFAVWPRSLVKEMTRVSERYPATRGVFLPVERRCYTLRANACPNLLVEMIPRGDEMAWVEDPEVGNISPLVELVAGQLNNWAAAAYRRLDPRGRAPNVAFHSDEGGRPDVSKIEFPIGAFFPQGLRHTFPDGPEVITTRERLAEIAQRCSPDCTVALHSAWLADLLRNRSYVTGNPGTIWGVLRELLWCGAANAGEAEVEALLSRLDGAFRTHAAPPHVQDAIDAMLRLKVDLPPHQSAPPSPRGRG